MSKLAPHNAKVAFYGVPGSSTETIKRMTGFTEASKSMNPKEYSRQYVDEVEERTDVTGYSTSISYNFDWEVGNEVHEDIRKVHEGELIGADAVRSIYVVDMTSSATTRPCIKKSYSVIPDAESGNGNAYNFSGNFKANGKSEEGDATTADDWKTITYKPKQIL